MTVRVTSIFHILRSLNGKRKKKEGRLRLMTHFKHTHLKLMVTHSYKIYLSAILMTLMKLRNRKILVVDQVRMGREASSKVMTLT